MDLKDLLKPLSASEIQFRVGTLIKSKEKVFATILPFKNARTDMTVLDAIVGSNNWQSKLRKEGDSFIAGIAIRTSPETDWIWKESNAAATNVEAEKGGGSGAFKRAGVMWGIGRGLYDFPKIFVTLEQEEYFISDVKASATGKLRPQDWIWDVKYTTDNRVKLLTAHVQEKGPNPRTKERFKYELKEK